MKKGKILKINKADNVVVALSRFAAGENIKLSNKEITTTTEIPAGHKLALEEITRGQEVIKYGHSIGRATEDIKRGEWVHTHNLKTGLQGKLEYKYCPVDKVKSGKEKLQKREIPTFKGYSRENGPAGIRNEIWLVNTVGCINKPVEKMAVAAREHYASKIAQTSVEGIYSFPHPLGCSQLGEDLANTQRILAGLVKHPNAGGVLVIGLGCENNQLDEFKQVIGEVNSNRVKYINLQDVEDGQKLAREKIGQLIEYAASFQREELPASELKIGLKCGGSDSFSGITANPLLGRISDRLDDYGGCSILSEVPEMFGAETILMNRARDERTFKEIVKLINDFKDYFLASGQNIYENPSPGNKKGGITTLEEKSLGNIEKGGTGIVNGVTRYGWQVEGKGLQLLESPGNDLISTTALTVAGAQLILFTTGRGTPFGSPVPTVKVSTNSELYRQKKHWIDYDAGRLLQGANMEETAEDFFTYLLQVASGEQKTKNEINDYREIAIFKTGVTL